MNERILTKIALIMLCGMGACWASVCCERPATCSGQNAEVDPVDAVLEQLNRKTLELKSYQGQIEYGFVQVLLESESLRKGVLYYAKSDGKPTLRINFDTLKREDEKEQKYMEQYMVLDGARLTHPDYHFKGIWLVHIDYEIEEVKYYQLAEPNDPNQPVEVFDLISRNFPMLGFTKTEDLKKQFEVTLVEPKKPTESEDFIQIHLKVKPNSIYKDDYLSIDFWVDQKLGLPVKVVAVKTEPEPPFGDICRLRFLNAKVNHRVDSKVFEFKIPKGFGEPEIIPLPEKGRRG